MITKIQILMMAKRCLETIVSAKTQKNTMIEKLDIEESMVNA